MSKLSSFFDALLNFFSPLHCELCGRKKSCNERNNFFCKNCLDDFEHSDTSEKFLDRMEELIGSDNLNITHAHVLLKLDENENYLQIIHSFKYSGKSNIGVELGKILGRKIRKSGEKYDYVIPVPIHTAKKRERGYNQSDYIAEAIAEELGIEALEKAVIRREYTVSQTTLSATERLENMKDVFLVKSPEIIQGKSLLIVDDVLTTGSTINSLAGVLIESGALSCDAASILKS